MGLAFQVCDDILGIWGKSSVTGKSSSDDIVKKKKTLPIIFALEKTQSSGNSELIRIYSQETIGEHDTSSVVNILNEVGAKEYASEMSKRYCDQALAELEATNITPSAKDELKSLAVFILDRSY